jgi:hypothetical protein
MAISERPIIVCLCGSSRFKLEFERAGESEALAGHIVLSLGVFSKACGRELSEQQVAEQHDLHRRRIDLADEVLVINPGGYVGTSTAEEVAYARSRGKHVRWLVEPDAPRLPLA